MDLTFALRAGATGESLRKLVDKAQAEAVRGELSRDDLAKLEQILEDPALADLFTPEQLAVFEKLAGHLLAESPLRDVIDLLPDLEHLVDPRELPERFMTDFMLLKQQLLGQPGLSREEKASRVFEFFARYAERFVVLAGPLRPEPEQVAQGLAGKLPPPPAGWGAGVEPLTVADRSALVEKFVRQLEAAGFSGIREKSTGEPAPTVAAQLLQKSMPAEVRAQVAKLSFDAPSWTSNAEPVVRPSVREPSPARTADGTVLVDRERSPLEKVAGRADVLKVNPLAAEAQRPGVAQARGAGDPRQVKGSAGTDKKLGGNLLWNFLHRFRSGQADQEEKELGETYGHLALIAVMVMAFLAVIVILVANM